MHLSGFCINRHSENFRKSRNTIIYDLETVESQARPTPILFENANADKAASARVTGIQAGHRLAFFLVQNAADWFDSLADDATFGFVDSDGELADVADGAAVALAVDGTPTDQVVFHSVAVPRTPDGVQHVLSSVDPGGETITVGLEDLLGGSDRDHEDVVMRVGQVEPIDFL